MSEDLKTCAAAAVALCGVVFCSGIGLILSVLPFVMVALVIKWLFF